MIGPRPIGTPNGPSFWLGPEMAWHDGTAMPRPRPLPYPDVPFCPSTIFAKGMLLRPTSVIPSHIATPKPNSESSQLHCMPSDDFSLLLHTSPPCYSNASASPISSPPMWKAAVHLCRGVDAYQTALLHSVGPKPGGRKKKVEYKSLPCLDKQME
jgi:hypothetical protein